MDRYEAAIVGAGPEGLVAAITLARNGVKTILLEKDDAPGGRAAVREFHPGFRASPYSDELPAFAPRLYRALELARNGAILTPAAASLCLSDEGASLMFESDARTSRVVPSADRPRLLALRQDIAAWAREIDGMAAAPPFPRRRSLWRRQRPAPEWPSREWAAEPLDAMLRLHLSDPALRLHLAAQALAGRAVSPFLAGSALHLLAPGVGGSGQAAGGPGRLGAALERIAAGAGVAIQCNAPVKEILVKRGRARGVVLADGEKIEARAVLSALDVKRTFLALGAGDSLAAKDASRVRQFRMAGQSARVLFALDGRPALPGFEDVPDAAAGPIHVVPSMKALSASHDSWRMGAVPAAPLVSLRLPSFADPRLAPFGKSVMTATVSAVPAQLADGTWTSAARAGLAAMALAAAEQAMPGVASLVLGHAVVVGQDMEAALGITAGDLDGGEFVPDQALGFRPLQGEAWRDGRTPVKGLYLGGASSAGSPILTGASGERAALALIADFGMGQSK